MDLYRPVEGNLGPSPTPILTGDDIYLNEPFRVLCEKHAVNKIHLDLATVGGIVETHKIGDMAEEYGLPMAMHFAGTAVSCMSVFTARLRPKIFLRWKITRWTCLGGLH